MADYLVQEGGSVSDRLLTESGGLFLLENGTGDILLETSTTASTGRFTLEDGSGSVLLEASATTQAPQGGGIIIPRRQLLVRRLRQAGLEEDEAIALSLLIRTRRRLH